MYIYININIYIPNSHVSVINPPIESIKSPVILR